MCLLSDNIADAVDRLLIKFLDIVPSCNVVHREIHLVIILDRNNCDLREWSLFIGGRGRRNFEITAH